MGNVVLRGGCWLLMVGYFDVLEKKQVILISTFSHSRLERFLSVCKKLEKTTTKAT